QGHRDRRRPRRRRPGRAVGHEQVGRRRPSSRRIGEIMEVVSSLAEMMPKVAAEKPLLELTGIGKTFHTDDVETRALAGVDLAVGKAEFVSISGPSGSGKSTLLSILGLLDVPTTGEYRIDGTDTAKLDPVRRAAMRNKSIGFIFQAFNLIGDLTVAENVELPLTYRGMPIGDRKKRV